VEYILRRSQRDESLNIVSALSQPSIPGMIYIEAPSAMDIHHAFQGVHTVYLNRGIAFVPLSDRVQLLQMKGRDAQAIPRWVRIKKGMYKGDLGLVVGTDSFTSRVRLRVIPRLSYLRPLDSVKGSLFTCPSPALFDPDQARASFGTEAVQQYRNHFKFQGMVFKYGLLERVLSFHGLITKEVHPTLEEIERFSESPGFDKAIRRQWEAEYAAAGLCIHDRVEIIEGQQKGSIGIIAAEQDDVVQVCLDKESDTSWDCVVEIPKRQVCKIFRLGDYIAVQRGNHAGKFGHVVKVSDNGLVECIASKSNDSEIKVCVFSRISASQTAPMQGLTNHLPSQFQVHALNLRLAQADCSLALPNGHSEQQAIESCLAMIDPAVQPATVHTERADGYARGQRPDPMAGRHVLVVKTHHYCGYYGIILSTHEHLQVKTYAVRLEATGRTIQIKEDHLVDRR
jgi:ribosomal protein L24